MRKDGRRIKDIEPMYQVVPHIMTKRSDSMNMITLHMPYEPINEYIARKRQEGIKISHMGLILAAYMRTVAEYPILNRFVVNKTVYAKNEFVCSFVILKEVTDVKNDEINFTETMTKVKYNLSENIFQVEEQLQNVIENNRKITTTNNMDNFIKKVLKIPGLLRFAVSSFKVLDKFGLLPRSVIELSPFHTSMVISNLASIRTHEIYHHCYDFGTTSLFLCIGAEETKLELKDGVPTEVQYLPLGLVMDERICSGFAFAKAFQRFKKYLRNPEILENGPEVVNKDF